MSDRAQDLVYPVEQPPGPGEVVAIAEGILWARLPLPFRLDHVNVYFIEDGAGWAAFDTGFGNEACRAAWDLLLAGPLHGRPITRLIVSHSHPDHIGLAGWLAQRLDVPLLTSLSAWLVCINVSLAPGALDAPIYRDIYLGHGLDRATTDLVATLGHRYLKHVTPLPPTFQRVVAGDVLTIGGRAFTAMTGEGHAEEQLMLHCPQAKVFLAADQVLARISPNVSVSAVDPSGDPLGLYLRSLKAIPAAVADDTLVLAGHQLPFVGLHRRCAELAGHHVQRCGLIATACAQRPHPVAELVPVLFPRVTDPHQLGFAFAETLAHVNRMVAAGDLAWVQSRPDGVRQVGPR
jgi:glyoxylase-like metal-dependent hydrolase (beta-lactamase superfamily II)